MTRRAFAYQLDIAKLTVKNLPWYPEDLDKTNWPHITGTQEPVLRFRWDQAWDHADNFYAIRMIVGYMTRHGAALVPSAVTALSRISNEDHQRRVVDKYTSLQKALRESGLLDSRNKRIVKPEPVAGTPESEVLPEGGGANTTAVKVEEKGNRASAAVIASRAKGVRDVHGFICLPLTHDIPVK